MPYTPLFDYSFNTKHLIVNEDLKIAGVTFSLNPRICCDKGLLCYKTDFLPIEQNPLGFYKDYKFTPLAETKIAEKKLNMLLSYDIGNCFNVTYDKIRQYEVLCDNESFLKVAKEFRALLGNSAHIAMITKNASIDSNLAKGFPDLFELEKLHATNKRDNGFLIEPFTVSLDTAYALISNFPDEFDCQDNLPSVNNCLSYSYWKETNG